MSTVKQHIHSLFNKLHYWRWSLPGRTFGIKCFRLFLVKNFYFNTFLVDSKLKLCMGSSSKRIFNISIKYRDTELLCFVPKALIL